MAESNLQTLVGLGYPQAWCLRALQFCGDNLEQAVEWMLNNGEMLEEAARENERNQRRKREQETAAEEDGWMQKVARELGFIQATRTGAFSSQNEEEENEQGYHLGFRMRISPSYSQKVSKQLAEEPATKHRLGIVRRELAAFTPLHDVRLVELVSEHCIKNAIDPLLLSPATVLQLRSLHATLPNLTPTQIGLRFIVLRNFNRRLVDALPLIDLSAQESRLANKISRLRGTVFTQVKKEVLERTLKTSHVGDAATLQANKQPSVVLDRTNASNKPLNVFGQLFAQVFRRIPLTDLRNSDRAFYCILAGEHSDDFGGPYRDALHQACEELMSSKTLFCACPSIASMFVPSPRAITPSALEMFEFIGVLMGIAIRTKTPLPLRLPALVWKQLCALPVLWGDLRELDSPVYNLLAQVEAIETRADWEAAQIDLVFAQPNMEGKVEELLPGGKSLAVMFDSRRSFCNLVRKKRLQECAAQCAAMKRGMATQVPIHLLSNLFTWEELSVLVCGREEIDLDLLRECTVYGDGVSETQIDQFWAALESFSQEERKRYLKFVWGRSTMPLSAADFERKHKINFMDVRHTYRRGNEAAAALGEEEEEEEAADTFLPISHTCFFSIDIPTYSSKQVLAERLLYAITNCTSIDADETTNARRSAEQDRAQVSQVNQDEEDFGWDD